MPDVIIKGMEMPETCYECPCGDNEFYECMATKDRISYHRDEYGYPDGERQNWCPLSPAPKVVRCRDCIHRPTDPEKVGHGFSVEFPDERCPCHCEDGWYSWMPPDDWFCANGERKDGGEKNG